MHPHHHGLDRLLQQNLHVSPLTRDVLLHLDKALELALDLFSGAFHQLPLNSEQGPNRGLIAFPFNHLRTESKWRVYRYAGNPSRLIQTGGTGSHQAMHDLAGFYPPAPFWQKLVIRDGVILELMDDHVSRKIQ
jgi:hypothetical protein